jgi:hypothetical protein
VPHRKLLTHEDDLFGRVALFNNLVTLDQVVECARIIATEMGAERPRRSLANVLIDRGYMTTQSAGKVQAALRKRAAEEGKASAAPAGPTPKPKPMEDRAPSGTSQVMVALEDEDEDEDHDDPAVADTVKARQERIRQVVEKIAPGRIYPEMLDYITRHKVAIIDVKSLAAAIEEPENTVAAALKHWRRVGVVRKEATHPFCFGPSDEVQEEIDIFLEAWHQQSLHALVLGYILACE